MNHERPRGSQTHILAAAAAVSAGRDLIDTGTDKRFVRRDRNGKFSDSDDIGRSSAQDQKRIPRRSPRKGRAIAAIAR